MWRSKDIAGCGRGMFADSVLGFVRRHAEEIYIQNRDLFNQRFYQSFLFTNRCTTELF